MEWSKLEAGWLKFNIDGASKGKPDESGVGGIWWDENGSSIILFLKLVSISDSNKAELFVVKEMVVLFAALEWSSSLSLLLECDSQNVIKWIQNTLDVP